MTQWRWADPEIVRARIAALHQPEGDADARLGDAVLREHQRDAARRLRRAMDRFGGALLADEVGLGKTYAALAAVRDSGSLLIVAPATLASMWQGALQHARLQADFISFETLSRREAPRRAYEAVIVDEAHHARNPLTQRYGRLASITRSARVLLLSATPVHNASRDLGALLALFLGSRAERITAADLTACIVRRTRSDVRDVSMPGRAAPVWRSVNGSTETLQAILDVPPPCPPRDGGDGGVLVTLSLVRAWASTEAALRAALRRRIARADALADALATGRHPTRAELRAWAVGDDATQLAFPELVSDSISEDARYLLDSVRAHASGARRVSERLSSGAAAADEERCAIIREIRRSHAHERIVVFSQYADSIREMFSRLRWDGGVASVTANGALVAGGPLTRTQVLSRFAPIATSSRPPSRAEAIELLLATDLVSEGLNLQDASVVIHLDLPWTSARLTQRLGRVWRIGSEHARVHEYAIAPPAPADDLLRVTQLLTRKAGDALSAIGEAMSPLLASRARPSPSAAPLDRVRAAEELRGILRGWIDGMPEASTPHKGDAHDRHDTHAVEVAGVRSPFEGWIAAVEVAGEVRLAGKRGGAQPSTDPRYVLEIARAATSMPCVTSPSRVARNLADIEAYLDAARAAADAGLSGVGSRARATAASRIAALAAAAPPHRRPVMSRLAADARQAVAASRSAGAERLLAALVSDVADGGAEAGEAWLERVIEVGVAREPNAADVSGTARVHALIVLVPVENHASHNGNSDSASGRCRA